MSIWCTGNMREYQERVHTEATIPEQNVHKHIRQAHLAIFVLYSGTAAAAANNFRRAVTLDLVRHPYPFALQGRVRSLSALRCVCATVNVR